MAANRKTGIAVDAAGGPVIDPTANVIALNEAANKRQDDLRQLNDRRIDAEIRVLAAKLDGVEARMILRSDHAKELRDSESRRIDAIRQVDVLAVGRTAEQQLAAVQTLAATTTSAAETIRASVASTATALATQLASTVSGLTERISALEKSSYLGAGKQEVTDPAMSAALQEVKEIAKAIAAGTGQSQGSRNVVTYISIGISILLGLLLLADRLGK